VTPHSRRIVLAGLALAFLTGPLYGQGPVRGRAAAAATTIVIVRHAEKATDDPRDPSLSDAGRQRARDLAAALAGADLTAVYATQYRRTRDTAAPAAAAAGIAVAERSVPADDVPAFAADLARHVLSAHAGRTVLIVGHSNTVPELVKALTGAAVAPIADDEYDRLYVVVGGGGAGARLIASRYGVPSRGAHR
jgi:phosphohistidine phosphatase SixA